MKIGGVIIENRFDVDEIINRHKKYFPYQCLHFDEGVKTMSDYNYLMTDIKFWDKLPFDYVLIFQHDSGLLCNGVEQFTKYDYVGAPWKFQEHGGNGGLSLRSRTSMVETLKRFKYLGMKKHGNEDIFFSNFLYGRLATRDVCSRFSVETIYKLGTIGYHAIDKYLTNGEVKNILNQYNNY